MVKINILFYFKISYNFNNIYIIILHLMPSFTSCSILDLTYIVLIIQTLDFERALELLVIKSIAQHTAEFLCGHVFLYLISVKAHIPDKEKLFMGEQLPQYFRVKAEAAQF